MGAILIISIYFFAPFTAKDDPTAIRESLIGSIQSLKSPAPVDAKTGDVYFPDAKLFVSKPPSGTTLTYSYDDFSTVGQLSKPVLSISSSQLINEILPDLYNAQNSFELFEELPHLQACQRGVSIASNPITDDAEVKLHHEQKVADGRNLYIYTDNRCAEAERIIDALKNLQSY